MSHDPTIINIIELESRVQILEDTINNLADSVLKLEDVLTTIASYIVPEEEKEKQ